MFVMAFYDWTVQGERIIWNERSCEATAREQQANRGEPVTKDLADESISCPRPGSSPEKDISNRSTVWVINAPVAI